MCSADRCARDEGQGEWMQTQTRQIALIAAPRARRGGVRQAREQFAASHVFRRAAAYCDRTYLEWYILSTTYGLLPPQQVIGAAESVFAELAAAERTSFIAHVADGLRARANRSAVPPGFVLLSSQRLAEPLLRAVPELTIDLPLGTMTFIERLRWFDERLQTRPRMLRPGPHAPTTP